MIKIGIISGGGDLPLSIGINLIKKKYPVCFFPIKNFTNLSTYNNFEFLEIELNSFNKIINSLKKMKINKIIMAGNILRPSINDIKFDIHSLSLIKKFILEPKGDDKLLRTISNFFSEKGFSLFNWKNECKDLFTDKANLTNYKPSKFAIKNRDKGINIFKIIGNADIGQSLVIQNQLVLGVEAAEGTDELLKRCFYYKKTGDKGVLIKFSKYIQHAELDLPTIGLNTFINIKKNKYEGVFVEKNKCVIINKDKIIEYCNNNNLFLSSFEKLE
tara:strand:+ start:858 stop:1676 length:819 start_codon:yes stop_codon:yes gene_type:complete